MNDLDPVQRSDQQLVADLAGGDSSAVAEIAQRYSSDLYDFSVRIVLDAAAAASVVEGVLERAAGEAGSKAPFLSVRAWLLGLTRDGALEVLRQRGRVDAEPDAAPTPLSPSDEMFVQTQDPSIHDLALWAWQSSRSQRPRDYSLLDLSLRRKLPPEEVAALAGLSRTGIYSVLGRLRGTFEESFSAAVLFYMGKSNCAELEAMANNGRELRPAVRKEIAKHAETCMSCAATLNGMPLASDLFAVILNVELPADFRATIAQRYPSAGLAAGAVAGAATAASLWDDDDDDDLNEPIEAVAPPVDVEAETLMMDAAALAADEYVEAEPEQPPPPSQDVTLRAPRMPAPDPSTSTTMRMPRAVPPPPVAPEPESVLDSLYGDEDDEDVQEDEDLDNFDLYGDEEPEPEDAKPDRAVPLTFTRGRGRGGDRAAAGAAGAAGATATNERIRFERQDLRGKPTASTSGGGMLSGGGRGIWVIALLIGIALVSGYLGWAFGDSIDSNGSSNKLAALPTRADGSRTLGCSSGPVTVEQGQVATLSLDPKTLDGYQIKSVAVTPVSAGAKPNAVVARPQSPTSVVFEANLAPGQANRLDEYRLSISLAKPNETQNLVSDCTVLVRAPAASVPAPAPTTAAPAATTPAAGTTPPAGGTPPAGSPTRVP